MLFVSEHCDKSILFPFEWLPVLVLPVLDPFLFSVFHHLSLFFFWSLSYQGFLCLLVIVFVVAWAIFLMVLSISLLSWLAAVSSVVLSRMGMLLNSLLNCVIASPVNVHRILFSSFGLGFVCEVSSVMNL